MKTIYDCVVREDDCDFEYRADEYHDVTNGKILKMWFTFRSQIW